MYAYDIWCWWKSFDVYTPDYFNVYVIEKIWYDKRLWDYIILRHWNIRFIYWHIYTQLTEWTRLKPKDKLWTTNRSWITTWHHLHIELWKNNNNIRWSYLYDKKEIVNNKSKDLQIQRWLYKEATTEILEFIKKYEWLKLTAYWDVKHFSIWYWTRSFQGETITQQEAERRAKEHIQMVLDRYQLNNKPIWVQIAVVSFVYNIWSLNNSQMRLLRNWYYRALWNNFLQYNKMRINWELVTANWLVKRRQAEFNLLIK